MFFLGDSVIGRSTKRVLVAFHQWIHAPRVCETHGPCLQVPVTVASLILSQVCDGAMLAARESGSESTNCVSHCFIIKW